MKRQFNFWFLLLLALDVRAGTTELSGRIATELRSTLEQPSFQSDPRNQASLVLESELKSVGDGDNSFTVAPFIRLDDSDSDRQHVDIRELFWLYVQQDWDIRVGIDKVFWGVLESNHLVDVINQSDLLEGYEGEQKLGQPMVHSRFFAERGIFEIFILPYFREREYPGPTSAFTGGFNLNNDAIYESGAGEKHVDWALRWSGNADNWEFGFAWFDGTSRVPYLIPVGPGELAPYYAQIEQQSLDVQYIDEEWLYRAEVVTRHELGRQNSAFGVGVERTFVGAISKLIDASALLEYSFDDRHLKANTAMQNDVFVGVRLAFNDANDFKVLSGIVWDVEQDSYFYKLKASRRFDDHWLLSLEAHAFSSRQPGDPVALLDRGDFVSLIGNYYF